MMFLHEHRDFGDLLRRVAADLDRDLAMVEKDYWVVTTLAALVVQGFEIWFKGGTSLSKGFALIERFSEDLDLRIDAGRVAGLSEPTRSWANNKSSAIAERDAWFSALAAKLTVPGCEVLRDPAGSDRNCRSAFLEVRYPSLPGVSPVAAMKPFVLIEAGRARVVPAVEATVSSWVGDWLGDHAVNDLPPPPIVTLRCVHPWVTALEKVDAVVRRFSRDDLGAASFVRHYEDIARILLARGRLSPLEGGERSLKAELIATKDIRGWPPIDHAAFSPEAGGPRWRELEAAWAAIGPWFWGPRIGLDQACGLIRGVLGELA